MAQKITYFAPEKIEEQITTVEKTAARLRDTIHKVAISILKAWHDKGTDYAPTAADQINRLMNASPYHAQAFSKWVQVMLNSNLAWSDEKEGYYATAEGKRLMGKVFIAARDKPFWEVSPPPSAKPLDLEAELAKLLDKAARHAKKPVEGDVIDFGMVKAIREAVAQAKASNTQAA